MKKIYRKGTIILMCIMLTFGMCPVKSFAEESEIADAKEELEEGEQETLEEEESEDSEDAEEEKAADEDEENSEDDTEVNQNVDTFEKPDDITDETPENEEEQSDSDKTDVPKEEEDENAEEQEALEPDGETEEIAQKVIVSFYTTTEESEQCLFEEKEADEEGYVAFPEIPELDGFSFGGWETEKEEVVDEDTVFGESINIYAVWLPNEIDVSDTPMTMSLTRNSTNNIGISETRPQEGQSNRYEFTSSEESWIVPVTGFYTIACAGGKGQKGWVSEGGHNGEDGYRITEGAGQNGTAYTGQFRLKKGTNLTIHVGGAATGTWGRGCGWSDGGAGQGSSGEGKYAGDGGGSSYLKVDDSKLISASGGSGGRANWKNSSGYDASGSKAGGAGGGVTVVNSLGEAAELVEGSEQSLSSNAGNGYITITLDEICLGVSLDTPTDWTNQDVEITAEVISEGEGLTEKYLSWEKDEDGNDIWTDATTYAVSQNGTYVCKIRDVAGNVEETAIEVTNIDKLQPFGEISADKTHWTKEDVILTITADDTEATAEYGKSGLADVAYLWGYKNEAGETIWEMTEIPGTDGETEQVEAWTDITTYTASQNGTYICKIRDVAGNVAESEYTVSNIDRTAPKITYTHEDDWYEGGTTITWLGNDLQPDGTDGCGLHVQAYSFDGSNWTNRNEKGIPEAGIYRIWVRDALDNVGEYEVEIDYDDRPSSGKGEPEVIEPVIVPEPIPEPEPESDDSGEESIPTPVIPVAPVKQVVVVPEIEIPVLEASPPVPEIKMPTLQVKEDPKTIAASEYAAYPMPKKQGSVPRIIANMAFAVSSGSVCFFVFGLILPIARVYEVKSGKYRKLGWQFIIGKKLDLRKYFENTEERSLTVKFGWLYARNHRNKEFTYVKPSGVEQFAICKEMVIER